MQFIEFRLDSAREDPLRAEIYEHIHHIGFVAGNHVIDGCELVSSIRSEFFFTEKHSVGRGPTVSRACESQGTSRRRILLE